MIKKLTISSFFLVTLILTSNSADAAYANIYTTVASKAVDHIMWFYKDSNNTEITIAIKTENNLVQTPEIQKIETKKKIWVTATAYSSTPWQTDNTPCITATGYDVCNKTKNIMAVSQDLVRSLGYHKQVKLPSLYGDEIFYIEDTMNARFVNRIDIHHDSTKDAREFGLKRNIELQII